MNPRHKVDDNFKCLGAASTEVMYNSRDSGCIRWSDRQASDQARLSATPPNNKSSGSNHEHMGIPALGSVRSILANQLEHKPWNISQITRRQASIKRSTIQTQHKLVNSIETQTQIAWASKYFTCLHAPLLKYEIIFVILCSFHVPVPAY